MLRRLAPTLVVAAALAATGGAAAPASARAETIVSSNWAGYAVTGPSFRSVSGRWTEPKGRCKQGRRGYASAWVGLGGFTDDSPGLEQTGTDLICTKNGRARHDAWYELVPAPSRAIHMKIRGGDKMSATVTVSGKRVTIVLRNRTTGKRFVKKLKMKRPGVESAEWVVEAPSGCTIDGHCQILRLGNFGTTRFARASATSASGHRGTISDPAWDPIGILLSEGAALGDVDLGATAVPSRLSAGGSVFSVTYRRPGAFNGFARKRALPTRALPARLPGHAVRP